MRELKENELKNVNGGSVTGIAIGLLVGAALIGVVRGCQKAQNKDENRHGYVNDGQARDRNPDGGINGPGR